ncbi:MAG TPA: extensin family protein [Allosphingosinicella sp.]|nr:extensin family protein [Allosphingosinicella sp.]
MRRLRRFVLALLLLAALALGGLLLYGHARRHPEDVPWTALDLGRPVGSFTGRKLAGLEGPHCQALLSRAGISYQPLPARSAGPQCGHDHAVRFVPGGALAIRYRPADLGTACPVAAALALWEWHVVQPAARRHFGREVAAIEHYGSYSCRRVYGRDAGMWSEHARANALDVAAFRLDGGARISMVSDWEDEGAKGRFLREVRDGACALFATVLSPDYNRAHRDHFHLDQARRGAWGWRACR